MAEPLPATLCIALSGRAWAWPTTAAFLDRQTYPHHSIRLRLLDSSGDPAFHSLVRSWLDRCDYPDASLEAKTFGLPGLADQDRPSHTDAVRQTCAAIYSHLAAHIETPLAFTLEDDIEPPADAFTTLAALVTGPTISASAFYLGRLVADPIAWRWDDQGKPVAAGGDPHTFEVGGHGFGAAAFSAEIFKPERFHAGPPLHDFDYNFFHQLTFVEGRRAVVEGTCHARHYSSPGSWVQTPATAVPLMALMGNPAPLHIAHLNAYDQHGGAEGLMGALIEQQGASGHHAIALVGHKAQPGSPAIAFDLDKDPDESRRMAEAALPDYEIKGSHRLPHHPAIQAADLVHAHNLYGGFFHPFSLIALSHARPVVWTLHDMQALTGYCSHALDCTRWQHGCGECPDLSRPGPALPFDNTATLWRDKQLIAQNSRLWLVAASTWMVGQLQKSLWNDHPITHIPNGIDTGALRPADRAACRARLGLPDAALIVGSLARSGVFSHPWKGGTHAAAAFAALRDQYPDALFLDIGGEAPTTQPGVIPLVTSTPAELREALNCLDFLLHPAIADTAPLSVIEAMACGIPVVAFRVGGLPDPVTSDTGLLAPPGDTAQLTAACLALAADPDRRRSMAQAARERAVTHYDRSLMASRYESLYQQAIVAHAGPELPRHTLAAAGQDAPPLHQLKELQDERLLLKHKLATSRAKLAKEQARVTQLVELPWTRLGIRLNTIRGEARKWIRRRSP